MTDKTARIRIAGMNRCARAESDSNRNGKMQDARIIGQSWSLDNGERSGGSNSRESSVELSITVRATPAPSIYVFM